MQTSNDWRKAPRRTYSTDFKMRMIEQALLPGASVAAIARENGFNDNLLFKWLRLWNAQGCLTRKVASASTDKTVLIPVTTAHPASPEHTTEAAPATLCRIELRHDTILLQEPSTELICHLIRELSGKTPT
jgi:transposase